jgi:polyphosphate kinase
MKKKYLAKEISWLSFNARILQEAADRRVPLLERIRFLGIYSSNLDEFFRVRVATLRRLTRVPEKKALFFGQDPRKILKSIQETVLSQHEQFDSVYRSILEELARERIFLVNERQLNPDQRAFVAAHFQQKVRPKLIPIMLDQVDKFPDLRDQSLYLAIVLSRRDGAAKEKYALIELPTHGHSRFLILPPSGGARYIMLLDDVIRFGLKDIFSVLQFDRFQAYTVKLTRDAELDLDDDLSRSVIEKVSRSLGRRRGGNPVRFIYDSQLPKPLLRLFVRKMHLGDSDTLIPGARYHNFRDFMQFPDFGLAHLRYSNVPVLPNRHFAARKRLLDTIRTRDVLLHYPYQSFDYVIDFLREASIDPHVSSIKVTIYRAARDSSVINALVNAARNGKTVTVVMELQARFDEQANINWGKRLQEDGVRVIYGVPGLKVHSKLCLVTREEQGKDFHYAIIGTGNFNEDTASVYSDHCLFTADPRLTSETYKVFQFFENNYKTASFKHLVVAPFNMRRKLTKLIQREIQHARQGQDAFICLKLNNLVDPEMIELLYRASQAGVRVRLIVRSMFSIVPGVSGLSENIEAISIVDRFLEHSRIFIFGVGARRRAFISSADLMPRNLDYRVEVTCPIYDRQIQRELEAFLDLQWRDNVKARVLTPNMDNPIHKSAGARVRAQTKVFTLLENGFVKTPSRTRRATVGARK